MKYSLFCMAATAMVLVGSAQAQVVYDFENLYNGAGVLNGSGASRPDGFHSNGALSVAQSTIGATLNTHSMLFSAASADTFDGALDDTPNTPGVDPTNALYKASSLTYDLTINAADPQFTGGFADLEVSVFYANETDPGNPTFGNQLQSTGFANIAQAPGTYTNQSIALSGTDPVTGTPNTPFGTIFSEPGIIPTGFEFIISKGGATNGPITIYLDNVNAVVPEPASLGACSVIGLLLARRRRAR